MKKWDEIIEEAERIQKERKKEYNKNKTERSAKFQELADIADLQLDKRRKEYRETL